MYFYVSLIITFLCSINYLIVWFKEIAILLSFWSKYRQLYVKESEKKLFEYVNSMLQKRSIKRWIVLSYEFSIALFPLKNKDFNFLRNRRNIKKTKICFRFLMINNYWYNLIPVFRYIGFILTASISID